MRSFFGMAHCGENSHPSGQSRHADWQGCFGKIFDRERCLTIFGIMVNQDKRRSHERNFLPILLHILTSSRMPVLPRSRPESRQKPCRTGWRPFRNRSIHNWTNEPGKTEMKPRTRNWPQRAISWMCAGISRNAKRYQGMPKRYQGMSKRYQGLPKGNSGNQAGDQNVELRLLKWQIGIGAALFTSIFTALAKGFHWFGFYSHFRKFQQAARGIWPSIMPGLSMPCKSGNRRAG